MKSLMVVLMLAPFCAQGGMLEMKVSGPGSEPAGITTVTETGEPAPLLTDGDDLPLMPGWPVKVPSAGSFGPARGVALADLDGDGTLEIIMPSTANRLYVWKYDGTPYPGWPQTLNNMAQYAASVADVDLDGEYEIAVCTRGLTSGGRVYLFDENGNVKPGWPFTGSAGGNFADSPTLVDIDGDDTLEIIVGERDWPGGQLYVLRHDGTVYSRAWPCSLDHVPTGGAAVGDVNLDGVMDIIYMSYNSIYVFQPDGSVLPGWPVTMPNGRNFSYQSAALADIDGDDTLEIITAMHKEGGGCYVFRHDGTVQPGWPYAFPRWTYCPPTVADLYRDGDLKVVCGLSGIVGGAAQVLYAFDDDGSVLSGFPYTQSNGDAADGNITVVDLDGGGDMEIVFASNLLTSADSLGYLHAVHHDGSPVAGWPLRPWGFTYMNGATVADVDGDDSLDIIAVSAYAGQMHVTVWEAGVSFDRMSWEWPTYHFNMQRTGLYESAQTGIEEMPNADLRMTNDRLPMATIVHGVLRMPETGIHHSTFVLLNSTGRKVMELAPGANDVRHLASGVYFLRTEAETRGPVGKLVIRN